LHTSMRPGVGWQAVPVVPPATFRKSSIFDGFQSDMASFKYASHAEDTLSPVSSVKDWVDRAQWYFPQAWLASDVVATANAVTSAIRRLVRTVDASRILPLQRQRGRGLCRLTVGSISGKVNRAQMHAELRAPWRAFATFRLA
jgi:hypothetical protein